MKDIKVSTLIKFLQALEECPRNTNRVNLRANLTFGTGLRVRNILMKSGFIEVKSEDLRSKTLKLTQKGRELLIIINEIRYD